MSIETKFLCRLCAELYPKKIIINSYSKEYTNFNIADKVYQYFIININENDDSKMSKDVCKQCYKKVVDIYEFHQQIIQSQEKLKLQIAGYNDLEEDHHILNDNNSSGRLIESFIYTECLHK